MTEEIQERIRIIGSYKSYYNWEDKTPDQQLRYLKWTAISEFILAIFFLSFIIAISAISVFTDWNLFAYAVLFYGVFMLVKIVCKIRAVQRNLEHFDNG